MIELKWLEEYIKYLFPKIRVKDDGDKTMNKTGNTITFDISQAPPSSDDLSEERRRLSKQKIVFSKKLNMATIAFWIVAFSATALFINASIIFFDSWLIAGTTALVSGIALSLLVTILAHAVYLDKRLFKPMKQTVKSLEDLVDLSPTDKPEQCIALDKWRDQNTEIDSYLKAIAEQGRKPVVSEYNAAREWMQTAGSRNEKAKKIEQAKAACERMAATI